MKKVKTLMFAVAIAMGATIAVPMFTNATIVQAAERPFLSYGDRGPAVKTVQEAINYESGGAFGFYHHISPDGIFGNDTEGAVRAFQSHYHISSDGMVGPRTWALLEADIRGLHEDEPQH